MFGPGKYPNNFPKQKYCNAACAHKALRKDMIASFWEKVDKAGANGCWNWTASQKEKGYGQFIWNGKMNRAHRLAWKLLRGDPGDKEVAHRCDNRLCVNPEHLFLATHLENMQDCKAKGRHAHGESNTRSKLTAEQVSELRSLRDKGWKFHELGARFGITSSHATNIYHRRAWSHIQ